MTILWIGVAAVAIVAVAVLVGGAVLYAVLPPRLAQAAGVIINR